MTPLPGDPRRVSLRSLPASVWQRLWVRGESFYLRTEVPADTDSWTQPETETQHAPGNSDSTSLQDFSGNVSVATNAH
jgi:hypothetical protein